MGRVQRGTWTRELDDFVRAFCGAFLFGIPLLFTMEMWWIGAYAELWKLLAFLASLGLTCFAGFQKEGIVGSNVDQATDTLTVGLVGSVIVLLVLNRIHFSGPLDSVVGKIMIEAIPLSIGASVGNAFFSSGRTSGDEKGGKKKGRAGRATLRLPRCSMYSSPAAAHDPVNHHG